MTYNIEIDDYIGRWGVSKQNISGQLGALKNKDVTVRINSLGGLLDHGLDIRQQFIDHGKVTAYLFGYVASAATVASLGASKICISRYAFYLVHKVSNWVDAWGQMNADQIDALIEQLKQNKLENDKMDLVLAQMYANKCKKKVNDILDILKKGEWLTAQEALDYGFVDEIIEDGEKQNFSTAMSTKFNSLGLPALPVAREKEDSSSLLNKILTGMDELMKRNNKKEKPVDIDNQTKTDKNMKKDFIRVNTILNVEGLVFENGKVALTEDQVKAMNDKMDDLEADVLAKQTTIDGQTTQIENLKNAAGDDTTKIEGGADDEDHNAFKTANDLYDRV